MDKKYYVKEHKNLIGLLNKGKDFVKEAKSQTKEMNKYKKNIV